VPAAAWRRHGEIPLGATRDPAVSALAQGRARHETGTGLPGVSRNRQDDPSPSAQILRRADGVLPEFEDFRLRSPGTHCACACGVGRPSVVYEPRRAADSVVYQVVRDHYETFAAQAVAWRDGEGLPAFIDEEFRGFLRCGWLAGGFARFRCGGCGLDRLVPFSCKGRAVCPSCLGRRMAERAAHLVDRVLPAVPVRQ
jgi:hypothetical protein